jgi:hypothetical protein
VSRPPTTSEDADYPTSYPLHPLKRGRLVPEDVTGLVRYLREHAAASS